ncbi:MAG: GNAT family N-acetyltransferase, partial [Planctomycetota bacterium]
MLDFRHQLDDDLALLPPLPRHAGGQFAAIERSRPRIRKWLNWVDETKSADDVRTFFQKCCRDIGRRSDATAIIQHRGDLAGSVGLTVVDRRDRAGEIGYWLAEGHEGQGVMTRAAAAMLSHGHGAMRLPRVFLCASTKNPKSYSVMQRIGCMHEATLAAGDPLPNGEITDQVVYAHIDDECHGEPIDYALPTDRPDVRLVLQQPHHAREIFAYVDSERERLEPLLRFVERMKTVKVTRKMIRESWDMLADERGEVALIQR